MKTFLKKDSFICLGITSREDYNCFHSLYKYFYPAYELKASQGKAQVCNTKAVIPGLAGAYQVYYDAPCFSHTMIFPTNMLNEIDAKVTEALSIDSKLTEEEARCAVWETKGRELGVKLINNTWLPQTENAIYTAPLSEIESGYSYVTVFHFADGTAVMSDVKQK